MRFVRETGVHSSRSPFIRLSLYVPLPTRTITVPTLKLRPKNGQLFVLVINMRRSFFQFSLGATCILSLSLVSACSAERSNDADGLGGDDGGFQSGGTTTSGGVGDGEDGQGDGQDDGGEVGGVEGDGGGEGNGAEGTVWEDCDVPEHVPCDGDSDDLVNAIGLNCPDELQFDVSVNAGAGTTGVGQGFGNTDTWSPNEGSRFAVMGSGLLSELTNETPPQDSNQFPTYCSDDIDGLDEGDPSAPGPNDPQATLPAPIVAKDVGAQDCNENPELIGTGDCSNSVQTQFEQGQLDVGGGAFDYAEMRIVAEVPGGASSFSYDFAFFSTEYPEYFGQPYNDMYIAWLESEEWTGNVSFDEQGNPISLNAGFLDYKDDSANLPEFDGTCIKQHGATKWLTSTASVKPGEKITVVLAIFDLSDNILDSYVFIDNFQWGCEGGAPPTTIPIG